MWIGRKFALKNTDNNFENLMIYYGELYRKYGYVRFKMSKFEEYDLYAENRNFLISNNIITFTERNGRLMALKPDVTLSIVKNSVGSGSVNEKVFYNESVYRQSKSTGTFKEQLQVGIENIGKIDTYSMGETVMLAAKSLEAICTDYILDLSHAGVISSLVGKLSISDPETENRIKTLIASRNINEIRRVCTAGNADPEITELLVSVISMYGNFEKVYCELCKTCDGIVERSVLEELREVYEVLKLYGCNKNVNLVFSQTADMNYYTGLTFQGFIPDIPECVLSGGRYDRLLEKFSIDGKAIGFAVYMDKLEDLLRKTPECDVDVLLLYSPDTPDSQIVSAMKELTGQGLKVRSSAVIPDKLRFSRLIDLSQNKKI